MTGDPRKLNCAAFQDQLPNLIGSGENIAAQPHLRSCALCRALVDDLVTIAQAARQLFPLAEPPDKLWRQIESAIKKEEGPCGQG